MPLIRSVITEFARTMEPEQRADQAGVAHRQFGGLDQTAHPVMVQSIGRQKLSMRGEFTDQGVGAKRVVSQRLLVFLSV